MRPYYYDVDHKAAEFSFDAHQRGRRRDPVGTCAWIFAA